MGKKFVEKIKTAAAELTGNLAALYLAYKRNDTPRRAKIMILITLGYALSPIDLIPDFIPVLGYLDDLVLVPFFIYIALKLIPTLIMAECREQAGDLWKNGRPKKWYYGIPVMALWVLIILVIVKNIFFARIKRE